MSGPLRVATSSTGLHPKRYPGIQFLSRADRDIGVLRNVASTKRPCLEFLRETGLILRCDGKGGNPFDTKQGNGPSCRDQEGSRGSDEVVPETRCSSRVRLVCRGNFWVASRVPSTVSTFKEERGTSPETPSRERASSWNGGEPRGFSRLAAGFSSYNGKFRMPPVLAQGSPFLHSRCKGGLGIALESLQVK